MAFNYDISVLELLDILGCQPNPDYQPDPRLPALLNDFLSRACKQPLFRTADIWTTRSCWFSNEAIEEWVEEDREYYEEHPEELEEDDAFGPFFKLPKEEWPTLVENYQEIGSDYAAGNVRCAVRVYERYSVAGGNRLSVSVTLVGQDRDLFLSAITAGGSQAMFFKINTWGEEAFLEKVRNIAETL